MRTAKKVLAAGHLCLDITPVFPPQKSANLAEVLAPGRLIHVGQAVFHLGGSVANTGIALKMLGSDVRLAARVGKDQLGQMVRNMLAQYGCDACLIEDDQAGSAYTIAIAVPGADRILLHAPAANNMFCAADITDEILEGVSHFHFGYPPLLKRMYERDGEELVALFRHVKAKGITTSLDMAAVDPSSCAGDADWRMILRKVLPLTDFFVPSIEEMGFILRPKRYEEWYAKENGGNIALMLSLERDVQPIMDEVMDMGAQVVLLKCGAKGIGYCSAMGASMVALCEKLELSKDEWVGQKGFERSFQPERIASTTGAGDTSIAAFLTAMLRGYPLEDSVRLAAGAGALCVATYDTLSGLMPLEALAHKIQSGWDKLPSSGNE